MEVCVDNLESAISAERGGAMRLELCSSLSEGGLTPSVGFLRLVKKRVKIPVFAMIRPRGGDFVYSEDEIEIMMEDMEVLKTNGADGFVFGIISSGGRVDVMNCLKLLQLVKDYPVTFHRGFDLVQEPFESMEEIIGMGFTRILTSGHQKTACQGTALLKQLVEAARDRIIIMPGAGINKDNIRFILSETNAVEFHGSAKVLKNSYFVTDENLVKDMITIYRSTIEHGSNLAKDNITSKSVLDGK